MMSDDELTFWEQVFFRVLQWEGAGIEEAVKAADLAVAARRERRK